jgi:hypothetical protein
MKEPRPFLMALAEASYRKGFVGSRGTGGFRGLGLVI